ncbi:MAG TPA: biopolymer transporter ExbD [Opitutaceae bacterium]|nr:biopolymer transporter ExbD [Opitutaceae bacterium]
MARTFRRQRTAQPIADLNLTNLIDLGFTLLIIFMIATPLIQQEQTIPVNLPAEAKRPLAKPPTETEFQTVAIDRKGNYYYGNHQVSFKELETLVAGLGAREKPPVVRIRADQTLQYQQVVRVMSLLMSNNITKITFDTQSQ